jgi:hypothetical protein
MDYGAMARAIREERRALWVQCGKPELVRTPKTRQLSADMAWAYSFANTFSVIFPNRWHPHWTPWHDFVVEERRKNMWVERGWRPSTRP